MLVQAIAGSARSYQDLFAQMLRDPGVTISAGGALSSVNIPDFDFLLYGFGFGPDAGGDPAGNVVALDIRSFTGPNDIAAVNFDAVLSIADLFTQANAGSGPVTGANYGPFFDTLIAAPTNSLNFTGSKGRDRAEGFAGDDNFDMGGGKDVVILGGGNDTINGGRGMDTIDGGGLFSAMDADLSRGTVTHAEGTATIKKPSIECIIGTDFGDELTGNKKDNCIFGNDGDDRIVGLAGNDRLEGGRGDDILYGDDPLNEAAGGDDVLRGGFGKDIIIAGAGSDIVLGQGGHDTIDGGAGDDVIKGGGTSDTISGGDGNDILFGNSGGDSLIGSSGNDTLHGGSGRDVFVFDKGHDEGQDTITDFNAARDKIKVNHASDADVIVRNDGTHTYVEFDGALPGSNLVTLANVILTEDQITFLF